MRMIPPRAPLNIVPFIDIMLVLLCMVLSVSTFIAQGEIKVDLPEADTQDKRSNPDEISKLLEISADNEIYFDGKKATPETVVKAIEALTPEEHLELRIDEKADFGLFVAVLDKLRETKHGKFSIATKKAEL